MSENFDPYYKWLGIAPAEQPPNHYRLLGLNLFESDLDVIENGSDRQMAHLRTFQTGPRMRECQRLLNEVAGARVVLLDPQRKAAYDESLRASLAPVAAPPPPIATVPLTPADALPPIALEPGMATATIPSSRHPASKSPIVIARRIRRRRKPMLGWGIFAVVCLIAIFAMYVGRDRLRQLLEPRPQPTVPPVKGTIDGVPPTGIKSEEPVNPAKKSRPTDSPVERVNS